MRLIVLIPLLAISAFMIATMLPITQDASNSLNASASNMNNMSGYQAQALEFSKTIISLLPVFFGIAVLFMAISIIAKAMRGQELGGQELGVKDLASYGISISSSKSPKKIENYKDKDIKDPGTNIKMKEDDFKKTKFD